MRDLLVLSVVADDKPGIVERVAAVIAHHGGNWTQSSMARLAGKFAGILLVEVESNAKAALAGDLSKLSEQGIRVAVDDSSHQDLKQGTLLHLEIVANDRPGIVGEISKLLAAKNINLESLETSCEPAPMTADMMFHAHAALQLPESLDRDDLTGILEGLSDDLMVEIVD